MDFLSKDISHYTIKEMKDWLFSIGSNFSLKKKADYVYRCNLYKKILEFSWRKDQKEVIDNFILYDKNYYCINAIFGAGKTTLLIGMLIYGIILNLFKPEDVLFISFNISVKNEIKRKLKEYGISSKVKVRTFDSIIYEICKNTGYSYINLPNFEGKRKYVYNLCFEECEYIPDFQPKIIFIDECQDLEKYTFDILSTFYLDSKIVFTGDIFQSIQKEPRESVLWYLINNDIKNCYKMYMNETPRVPEKILCSLKKALSKYYPEFKEQISEWKSANKTSECDIEWKTLTSYTNIFEELKDFCEEHTAEESMILTFSSSITVRGQMGDISRLRRFLLSENLNINNNHKRNEPENYFLTTANSSKGLERDYVICFLTFPLEKAFINFSDDVVVNLITVALTRAKKKVIFYVPKYEDKYSRVLSLFEYCPKPSSKIKEEIKGLNNFSYSDYINTEVSVTQLIRQSIIKYDTRIKLTENYAKPFKYEKIFPENYDYKKVPKIIMEEEKQFVGIFIENLITSTWCGFYPSIDSDIKIISNNPMYSHCMGKIKSLIKSYNKYNKKIIKNCNQFEGIYIYSQLHLAISDKIFMKLSNPTINSLKEYWNYFKNKCNIMKPVGNITIQSRLHMPWVTGVADVIENNQKEITIYEIKASSDIDWVQNALIQAIIYSLMTGKSRSKIILINPFRNEKVYYSFNTYIKIKNIDEDIKKKNILYLRELVINDVLIYNLNCFMAKNMDKYNINNKKIDMNVTDNLFLNIEKGNSSLIKMISPIKCELIYHKFFLENDEIENDEIENDKIENDKIENDEIENDKIENNKIENDKEKLYLFKRQLESINNKKDILKELKHIFNQNINKDNIIYSNYEYNDIDLVKFEIDIKNMYTPNKDKKYGLNLNNSFHKNILYIGKLFKDKNFI